MGLLTMFCQQTPTPLNRRRLSIGPNPTEASKPLPIWRGTEISNPFPSSRESANHRFLGCSVPSVDGRGTSPGATRRQV